MQKRVGEKQADRLRLPVVAGGHGAFVAAFRNRAEIVRAHVNRQSPKSAALALAKRDQLRRHATALPPHVTMSHTPVHRHSSVGK